MQSIETANINLQNFVADDVESYTAAQIKAHILSSGVKLTQAFIDNYGAPYIEKRRAYGNSDPSEFIDITVPQELYILPERVICAVNIRYNSQWSLDFKNEEFLLIDPNDIGRVITFPKRPAFYEQLMSCGKPAKSIATLYGGGSIGFFVNGSCSLVTMNKPCQYCSIKPNHDKGVDFVQLLKPDDVYEATKLALKDTDSSATQIMCNGGNFVKSDRGFKIYIEICKAARCAIDECKSDAELHLITYPPENYRLLEQLADLDVSIAMNTEVFDPKLFAQFCPGKDAVLIFNSLQRAAEILGKGKVFSIFVGGLESVDSMAIGFERLAEIGVIPVVNVFHPDPGTLLANRKPPSQSQIMAIGLLLQQLYQKYDFMRPFYMGCGRNAIDTEAYLGLF